MEVRVLLPQPFDSGLRPPLMAGHFVGGECPELVEGPFFGSQALTVKPPPLKRQNSEHYRGVPPVFARREAAAEDCRAIARVQRATAGSRPMARATTRQATLARWRSSQRSSLIRRRPRVRIPLEPPFLSKRGRAANAARCKRDALTGYEGASPSASTILASNPPAVAFATRKLWRGVSRRLGEGGQCDYASRRVLRLRHPERSCPGQVLRRLDGRPENAIFRS